MSTYQITLKDRSLEHIDDADAYQQEGPMTTFFQTASGRDVVDTWSTRVASFRTSEVVAIRRLAPAADRSTSSGDHGPDHRPDHRPDRGHDRGGRAPVALRSA